MIFSVEHLFDSSENEKLVSEFKAMNDAQGLEDYLKYQSSEDEKNLYSRTYLIKDKVSGELACYFSLRSGLITIQANNYKEEFDTIPAVELSNFAMNGKYRENHPETHLLGFLFLKHFILPLAQTMSRYIGANSLYIYALPDEKLIEHYEKMGFSRLPKQQEKFVQKHVKPQYDEGCIFMFQNL